MEITGANIETYRTSDTIFFGIVKQKMCHTDAIENLIS
mgnify:CR=1 FL=1